MTDQDTLPSLVTVAKNGTEFRYLCCCKCRDEKSELTLHWYENDQLYKCDCGASYKSLAELDYL